MNEREERAAERRAMIEEAIARIDESLAGQPHPDPEVARVLSAVDEFQRQVDELIASFPLDEQAEAKRRLYRDADGVPRTRHRSLRIV